MGIETVIYAVIYIVVGAAAYTGYVQAKKAAAAAAATSKNRGLLQQVKAAAFPRRSVYGRRRIGGLECYVAASGAKNEYLHYILIWADGPCDAVEHLLFDGEIVPMSPDPENAAVYRCYSGKYAGKVRWETELGTLDQGARGVGIVPGWGDSDRLYGICYSWVELKWDTDVFVNGVPDISAVIRGRNDIYDPRYELVTGSGASTGAVYQYTDNVALCAAHWMTTARTGLNVAFERINLDSLIDAANVCDEAVPLSNGGTQKRYIINHIVSLQYDPDDIIQDFRAAMAGAIICAQRNWYFHAGAYQTPTFEISQDMLIAPFTVTNKASKKDSYNTVKAVFVSEERDWQPTDILAYQNPAYLVEDGRELVDDLDLSFINNHARARRLAKIHLVRSRLGKLIRLVCDVRAIRAVPGAVVLLNLPEHGYANVPVLVLEFGFSIIHDAIEIELSLQVTGPEVYDWDPESEDHNDFEYTPVLHSRPLPPPGLNSESDILEYPDLYSEVDKNVLFPDA